MIWEVCKFLIVGKGFKFKNTKTIEGLKGSRKSS